MCPHSDTFITFRSATDAQMEMSIKHAFTFFYPAPDRDNYLLDESTDDRFPVGNYCYKQHDSESITP